MTNLSGQSLALAVGVSALLTVACRKLKFPALLPLLAVGLALGPSGAGVVDGSSLGDALRGFVTVSIGLLIFEGALHLNREELSQSPRAVWGLLTIGAATTWIGSAAAAHWLLGMSLPIAAILGAALIVTGPTVVQPILRLVRVSPRLHSALGAEAVLIDPIGVVATIATLEAVRLYAQTGPDLTTAGHGFWAFVKPFVGGAGVGVAAGVGGRALLRYLDQRGRPDPQFLNLLAIGLCMTCVGVGEAIAPEAGLAAVTICGVFVARARVLGATELRSFKELLATILVGTLFILLSSRFDAASFRFITLREALFVLVLIFVVRPACVLLSTWKSKLSWQERAFAAVFAPRGIVALSVIAIVAADIAPLSQAADEPGAASGAEEGLRLEAVMFLVIAGTVLAATTLSPILARILGVAAGRGNAVMLIGAHPLAIAFARALEAHGVHVRLIDRNPASVAQAAAEGHEALTGDATDTRWLDDAGAPHDAGWALAWTGNDDVDQVAARWAEERFGAGHALLWSNKPAHGALSRLDIDPVAPLAVAVDQVESGDLRIVDTDQHDSLTRILAWVDGGVITLAAPGANPLAKAENSARRFIGLVQRSAAPPAPPRSPDPAPS